MLRRVLEFDSLSQAAVALAVPRTHVLRLMERAAREVGVELDWRAAGARRLFAPAEIHRLVKPERIRELERAAGYPTIACGTMMQIWFQCQTLGDDPARCGSGPPNRLRGVRSTDAIGALQSFDVDLALVHEHSGFSWESRLAAHRLQTEGAKASVELTCRRLAGWTAVGVGPARAPLVPPAAGWRITWWSPDSSAGQITQSARRSKRLSTFLGNEHGDLSHNLHLSEPGSWLGAYESARRGLPIHFILPDIFVARQDRKHLTIVEPESPDVACHGAVFALYRSLDEARLESIWQSFPTGGEPSRVSME